MLETKLIEFQQKTNKVDIHYGNLIALENNKNIPFSIKRLYYIFNVEIDTIRGYHAHKTLKQVLVCVYGSIEVTCVNGLEKEQFTLNDPSIGLFIGKDIWRTMKWIEKNSVLVVLASDFYNEKDYIRDYEYYLEYIKINRG